jgi:hypothetical protein
MKRHKGNTWEQDKAIELGIQVCKSCHKVMRPWVMKSRCLCQHQSKKWNGLCIECKCGCEEE